jgi:hypothetical protein
MNSKASSGASVMRGELQGERGSVCRQADSDDGHVTPPLVERFFPGSVPPPARPWQPV